MNLSLHSILRWVVAGFLFSILNYSFISTIIIRNWLVLFNALKR
jgi:hypothetical protein|eukprot:COSAG01_NODE_774_length_13702_cov_11.108726_3_plen_44_part_00